MVGTSEQAIDYLMTGKTDEEKNKMFINRIQRDIATGFNGLANSLEKLNNLDTSKMKPKEKAMYEYLLFKVNTVPQVSESDVNVLSKPEEYLKDFTNEVVDDTIDLFEEKDKK